MLVFLLFFFSKVVVVVVVIGLSVRVCRVATYTTIILKLINV